MGCNVFWLLSLRACPVCQVQYLSSPEVTSIVVVSNGAIVEQGTYASLMQPGSAFKSLVDAQQSKPADSGPDTENIDLAELAEVVHELDVLSPTSPTKQAKFFDGSDPQESGDAPLSAAPTHIVAPATVAPKLDAPLPITKRRESAATETAGSPTGLGSPTPGGAASPLWFLVPVVGTVPGACLFTRTPCVLVAGPTPRLAGSASPGGNASPAAKSLAVFTKSGRLIEDERMNTESMAWSVYRYYFFNMAAGYGIVALVALYLLPNPLRTWADTWYGQFAADTDSMTVGRFVWVYVVLMASHLIATALRSVLWAKYTVTTANYIHDRAVATLLRCPTSFFETTYAVRVCLWCRVCL